MRQILLLLLLFLALHSWGQQPDTLHIATYRYAANDRVDNLRPFAAYLGERTGIATSVASYPSPKDLIAAMQAGKVDIGFINTFGYLLLTTQERSVMTPVAALNVRKGASDNYKTILLSSKASGVTDAGTLKAKAANLSLLLVSEGSTSGNLVPRMYLNSLGLNDPEKQFKKTAYGKTHAQTFQQVAKDEVDVAAFGSSEYAKALAADSTLLERVNVLWESEEIALGPVLLKKSLPGGLKKKITKELLALHKRRSPALESIKKGWSEAAHSERFIRADDRHYDAFRNLMGDPKALRVLLERFVN
ncbi:MAG: putative phosphite transport system-binding protein HtxB [Saprospiraceae bacterium]|nr:putative phosphite transport system-binding protein HtxB [Saprospiraceae bacterium]